MKLYADIPVWLIPIIISLIILITSRYVFTTNSLKRWLAALRGLIWIILILVAANPWLSWVEKTSRFPKIGIWVDRSQSVPSKDLEKLIDITRDIDSTDYLYIDLNTGKQIRTQDISSRDPYTDFSKLEKSKFQFDQEWLLSDGNANRGKRNIELAKARIINVIAVGDTVTMGDIAIADVTNSLLWYVGVEDTIDVYLSSRGYDEIKKGTFILKIGSRIIRRQRFSLQADGEKEIKIPIRFQTSGRKTIGIEILTDQKDADLSNNKQVIQVNVAKKKKELLFVYGYPIPEIRYLKFFLQDIRKFSIIDANEEYWSKTSHLPDAIVLFAYPKKKLSSVEIDFWKKAEEKKVPVLYFSHEDIDFQQLDKLNLPFIYDLTQKPEELPLDLPIGGESNPIINPDLWPRTKINNFFVERPPVVRDFRIRFKEEGEVLLKSLKDKPGEGFFVMGREKQRHVALIAGWNSYLLHTSALSGEVYPLWENIMITAVEWITAPPLTRGLYYQIPDTLVQNANSNKLDIRVINSFGQNVANAKLSLTIREDNWLYENTAQYTGLFYSAELPYMPVGDFELTVKAHWGMGEKLEKKSRFYVANIGPEKQLTHLNKSYLNGIAKGRFISMSELKKGVFLRKQIGQEISREIYLFPRKWILWVILALFILDLYLRKKFQIL